MQYNHTIDLDMMRRQSVEIVTHQYDDAGRAVRIRVLADGEPATLPANADIRYSVSKPDGTFCTGACSTVNEDNKTYVVFTLTYQMLVLPGRETIDISIRADGASISTMTFINHIQRAAVQDGDVESSSEFDELQVALQRMDEIRELKEDAEQAVVDAQAVVDGIQSDRTQITTNKTDIAQLKEDLENLDDNVDDLKSAIGETNEYVGFYPAVEKIIDPSGTRITISYSEIPFPAQSGEIVVANVTGTAFANDPTIYLYGMVNGNGTSLGTFKANQDKSFTLAANYDGFAIYATSLVSGKTIDFKIRKGNVIGLNKRIIDLENLNPVSQNGVKEVKTLNLADVSTNVIADIGNKTLTGTGKHVREVIYYIEKVFAAGDTYYLTAKNIIGASVTNSLVVSVYHDSTEIRRISGNTTNLAKMKITADDVTAGANKIEFMLYPAMNTALAKGSATFYDVKISEGELPYYSAVGNLKDAVFGYNNFNLPDYYFANGYLTGKTDRINELASAGDDVFFFITDVHWSINAKYSPDLINYISRQCNIHRLFDGGDISMGTLESMKMPVDAYRDSYSGKIYRAAGNHDWFSPATAKSIYYGLNETVNNDQIGDVYNLYWYTDNVQSKIRYVVLNSFRHENSTWSYGFDATQINWFTNVALDVPDGYDVIVFTHYFKEATGYSGYIDIESAIATFNADTSSHGKVLCIFQGHTHYDSIWETSSGVPVITTTCDKWDFSNEEGYEAMASERSFGNKSEQAFDVVVLNRAAEKFYCVRIGYPAQNNIKKKIGDTGFTFVGTLEEREVSYM